MRILAKFNDLAAYTTWHDGVKTQFGYTDETSPYAGYFTNPLSEVAVRIDSQIDQAGLTIINEATAVATGFLDPITSIKNAIARSKVFGDDLIAEFGAENIALGYDTATIATISSELFEVQLALQSGSIYVARQKIDEYPTNGTWLTQTRKDAYLAKIDAYIATL